MKYIIVLLFSCAVFIQTQAQDSTKQTIKGLIDTKQYVFEPTSTSGGGGRVRQLTPGYFFEIKDDTLKTYLPYYGRAYTAPMNPSDIGYDFTTTNFSYDVAEGKKNSYNIVIRTKDKTYNPEFTLTVYDNGTAYLRASSSGNRCHIMVV